MRAAQLGRRWRKLDLLFAAAGAEIADLFLIALALAILCAPVGFGVAATWAALHWAHVYTGHAWLGWIAGAAGFIFCCRYVWGSRLQRAARRAAALIAGK